MTLSRATLLLLFLAASITSAAPVQDKQVCDLVDPATVESILGVPLQPPEAIAPFRSLYYAQRRDPATGRILGGGAGGSACRYANYVQGQPVPPKAVTVFIELHDSAAPNPMIVDDIMRNVDEQTYDDPTLVPGLGDIAFWVGPSSKNLISFSGGKRTLLVYGDLTLDQAKALTAKALGTTPKTGFVYGPPPLPKPALGARPAKPNQIDQLKFDLTAKAETGSAKAQFALGNFYENGMIGPDGLPKPDYSAAAYWYRQASDRGEPAASYALGLLYRDGKGMAPNPGAALDQFRKAATAGFTRAMVPLANAYIGAETDTSMQRAQRWARAGADAGDPEGHLIIGYFWNKGWMGGGKPYTYQQAMQSYQKAAEGGDCVAMMNIGGLYFNGDGVPQDKAQAESWFNKARTCTGSDLDWMRDKAARYQQRAAGGKLPPIATPAPGSDLVKLGNSILSMMSMTLGMDVLAADSEEKLANMSLEDILRLAYTNRRSACVLSGFAKNMGVPLSAC
jgi:TPR repeat protein